MRFKTHHQDRNRISPEWGWIILVPGMLFTACQKQEVYDNPRGPVIESIYPEQGRAGTTLSIYGENFSPALHDNRVSIGETDLPVYRADSSTLEVVIPAGLRSGPVTVSVKQKTTTGPLFTYLPTITVSTLAGSGLIGLQDGTLKEARFNTPRALALDGQGTIYVADQENHAIRKISPDGSVSTLAGDGTPGYTNGQGSQARFRQPVALVVNADGNLYVADFGNNVIRKVTPEGTVTTLAGDSVAGKTDGIGTAARFAGPAGIVAMPNGIMYVSDYFNHVIRLVTPAGQVTTWAGTGTAGMTDGDLKTCQFTLPAGMSTGPGGDSLHCGYGKFPGQENHSGGLRFHAGRQHGRLCRWERGAGSSSTPLFPQRSTGREMSMWPTGLTMSSGK